MARHRSGGGTRAGGTGRPRAAARLAVVLTALAALLSGCGPRRYPRAYEEQFLVSCGAGADKAGATVEQADVYCTCVLSAVERQYTYAQFRAIADRLGTPGYTAPARFLADIRACQERESRAG